MIRRDYGTFAARTGFPYGPQNVSSSDEPDHEHPQHHGGDAGSAKRTVRHFEDLLGKPLSQPWHAAVDQTLDNEDKAQSGKEVAHVDRRLLAGRRALCGRSRRSG